jgi:hypothetical protein
MLDIMGRFSHTKLGSCWYKANAPHINCVRDDIKIVSVEINDVETKFESLDHADKKAFLDAAWNKLLKIKE